MSTIALERYIAAFDAWARVSDQQLPIKQSIARIAAHLRTRFRGEVEIEELCREAHAWSRANHLPLSPDIGKSCLLGRMVYGGEDLRTRKCPIHDGEWSGCSTQPCPAGCNYGINLTGWLPNDHVEEWPATEDDGVLEALGEAVRESWSREHLAVYADRLIALGDPRGELITLELAMGDSPTVEQHDRHEVLVTTCFGDLRSTALDELRSTRGIGPRAKVELGFLSVDAREPHDVRKIYNARNGRYLRKLAIQAESLQCMHALAMVSLRPHPWLERLTVVKLEERNEHSLPDDTARALFANTPNLTSLTIAGTRMLSIDVLPVTSLWLTQLEGVQFEHAPRLSSLVLSMPRFDRDLGLIVDSFMRRAPALETIHVPAEAIAGLDHPKVRVLP